MKPVTGKYIIPVILLAQVIYCWYCFYKAGTAGYDANIGLLLHAFIISAVVAITAWILVSVNVKWFVIDFRIWLVWAITGSPLTFIIAAIYYTEIFGVSLQPG